MIVPAELITRRAELEAAVGLSDKAVADAERERAVRAAQLEEVSAAISIIEAAACAPAHTEAEGAGQAKRRNVRKMVLDLITENSPRSVRVSEVAGALKVEQRSVDTALAHWAGKERIEVNDGAAGLVRATQGSPPLNVAA